MIHLKWLEVDEHTIACRIHTENYGVLLSDVASSLDWSMICPGAVCQAPFISNSIVAVCNLVSWMQSSAVLSFSYSVACGCTEYTL